MTYNDWSHLYLWRSQTLVNYEQEMGDQMYGTLDTQRWYVDEHNKVTGERWRITGAQLDAELDRLFQYWLDVGKM